jgi:hypothetical protein
MGCQNPLSEGRARLAVKLAAFVFDADDFGFPKHLCERAQ